jgi:hypothetical protein
MQGDFLRFPSVLWIKKKSLPVLVGLAGAATCYHIGRLLAIERTAMAQVEVIPFTLETEIYSFEGNPKGELVATKTVARRSDGALALVGNIGRIEWGETARRVTYPDGRSVSVVDSFQARITWPPMSARSLASFKTQLLHAPRNCVEVGETLISREKANGQDLAIVRASSGAGANPGAGASRITFWRAVDLACQTLTNRVEASQSDGSWKLLTEQRVVNLKLGEPNALLFDDGSAYSETRPSEVERRLLEKAGVSRDTEPWKSEAQRLDKAYSRKCDECEEQQTVP